MGKDKIWKLVTKDELVNLFYLGETFESIGETYGITSRSVRYKCEKFGIVMGRTNAASIKNSYTCQQCSKIFKAVTFKEFCNLNCKNLKRNLSITLRQDAETDLGKTILSLRKQGLSYTAIVEKNWMF